MSKILNILGIVIRVLATIVLFATSVFSLATAYIVFAPDTFPKPFYLQYAYPTPVLPEIPLEALEATPEVIPELKAGEGVMVDTGTKIINLADPSGKKYIRVTVVLEFAPDNPEYASLPEEEQVTYLSTFTTEVTSKMPVIDDVIITLLSTKSFDEMYTADGKEALRNEIMQKVSERLPEYQILSLYFTEFIVD